MAAMIEKSGLQVAGALAAFIDEQALPGTGIAPDAFWAGVARIFTDLAPENRALLNTRDDIQARIDAWHEARRGKPRRPTRPVSISSKTAGRFAAMARAMCCGRISMAWAWRST